ncbi:MAG: WbqC family protein [Candidatus Omnitrophica bacterium]|nr:WbqC family protein [Candidatus Omnitrophota bacterium]
MKVAIMQPTYLPWIGYFGLMNSVDIFVFLDSVQFSKQSWQQRNRIKTPNGTMWLTVPTLSKGKSGQLISEVAVDLRGFQRKHRCSIEQSYKHTRYFDIYAPALFGILEQKHTHLSQLNMELILCLKNALGIQTKTMLASEISAETASDKVDYLVGICNALQATEYYSPVGSKEYLSGSLHKFSEVGISVHYNEFLHPTYSQKFGEFVSHLAVIDLLFNEGPKSLDIIKRGYETSFTKTI